MIKKAQQARQARQARQAAKQARQAKAGRAGTCQIELLGTSDKLERSDALSLDACQSKYVSDVLK